MTSRRGSLLFDDTQAPPLALVTPAAYSFSPSLLPDKEATARDVYAALRLKARTEICFHITHFGKLCAIAIIYAYISVQIIFELTNM